MHDSPSVTNIVALLITIPCQFRTPLMLYKPKRNTNNVTDNLKYIEISEYSDK